MTTTTYFTQQFIFISWELSLHIEHFSIAMHTTHCAVHNKNCTLHTAQRKLQTAHSWRPPISRTTPHTMGVPATGKSWGVVYIVNLFSEWNSDQECLWYVRSEGRLMWILGSKNKYLVTCLSLCILRWMMRQKAGDHQTCKKTFFVHDPGSDLLNVQNFTPTGF